MPHLLFRSGASWFAVDATDVREAALRGFIAHVPGAPPDVVGVAVVRGRAVPVVKIEETSVVGGGAEPGMLLPRLIVMAAERSEVAVIADETGGIEELEVLEQGGDLAVAGRTIRVIDPAALMTGTRR